MRPPCKPLTIQAHSHLDVLYLKLTIRKLPIKATMSSIHKLVVLAAVGSSALSTDSPFYNKVAPTTKSTCFLIVQADEVSARLQYTTT